MTTQVCRDVIGVIRRYVHPLKAQYLLEHYCDGVKLNLDNFSVEDLPKFILYLARKRDSVPTVDDGKFFTMMSNLVTLSNHDSCNQEYKKIHIVNGELN